MEGPDNLSRRVSSSEVVNDTPPTAKTSYCGREVKSCNCISPKTLFTITTIVGVILLVIGVLALAGLSAPTAAGGALPTLLQKLNSALSFVATKIGTDSMILAAFPIAFGLSLTLVGCIGLYHHRLDKVDPSSDSLKRAPTS